MVAEYKIKTIYKIPLSFYTLAVNNPKIKLRKSFHLQQHRKKYSRISLTKILQNLYFENYKTQFKIKEELNINMEINVHGLENLLLLR